ncbi:MAG: glycosyltransferase family 4 protein [Candidatus Firestonebacteria bacterium]|nr:glycosyltransferase family 4 protein [Candidatus Firestonebacteria bacterium]
MNIVINAIPLLSTQTGVGNCIFNISHSLLKLDKVNRYTFYYGYYSTRLQSSQEPGNLDNEVKFITLQRSKSMIKKIPFLGELSKSVIERYNNALSRKMNFDVYYEPNYIPSGIHAKHLVTTVHDLSFHHHPEWHPDDRVKYFKRTFFPRVLKSDVITTDSHFIKQEVVNELGIAPDRVRVIYMGYDQSLFKVYPAAEVEAFRASRKLPKKFILFVGSIEPRKNLERLLIAYLQLPEAEKRECKLVLSGFAGWKNSAIMNLIQKAHEHVIFLGYLSVHELALLYNAATIFAYPSLYEGFGLPPIEAMACGTPVLVSRAASLPEVCGDAALYCDPLEVDQISSQLQKLFFDEGLQKRLVETGFQKIRNYTWDKSAEQLLQLFREISGRP